MLYVGIDQHVKQLTVCVRDESGSVVRRLQVSTHPAKMRPFLEDLQDAARQQGGFVAIVEICGFNAWLVDWLNELDACREVVVIRPHKSSARKTDRRDAARLSELLWVNRQRLLEGQKVQGIRRVMWASKRDAENRQLTFLRQRLGKEKTVTINRIKHILHKHNLIHQQPVKTFQSKTVRRWLEKVALPRLDRLEMKMLLQRWDALEEQILQVEEEIADRVNRDVQAQRLRTMPRCGVYTALALASRIGPVDRFPAGRSLANFFGLTPKCHQSGEDKNRLGHITKEGSPLVRFLLAQLTTHVLRGDAGLRAWHKQVKRRRGAKIAKVAVMRKLAVSIWHMLKHEQPYRPRPEPAARKRGTQSTRGRIDAQFGAS